MNENEANLIIKDLENINRRMDRIDERLDKFIKDSAQLQTLQNEIKTVKDDQTRNRESLDRAFKEIDRINKLLVDPLKIEAAIKELGELKSDPMKKDAATVKMVRDWIKVGVGIVVTGGIASFITWVIVSFSKR